jgi:DNA recombination protein RmuC
MREQAHVIKEEVIRLIEDVGRLDERAQRLKMHFGQANKDLDDILISTRKVSARGQRIGSVEFDTPAPAQTKRVAPVRVANGPELPFNGAG